MPWLNVPPLQQAKEGWCLPACIAMIAAYWQQPLLQDDVARWLGTSGIGTPANRVQRLAQRGFEVIYEVGSLAELSAWLARSVPCILFARTGDLPYWQVDTPHAVVLTGLQGDTAYLFDPAIEIASVTISSNDMILAWSHFDYTYTAFYVSS
jgi:ABC-type bacteriocin/lantibiotic exporter with double-glycine peptidase domain